MRRPIPRLVTCLIFAIGGVLAARPALAQVRRGPMIGPSAVVPLAKWPTSTSTGVGNSGAVMVPPLTREQYKAAQLRWMRVGMLVGFAAGVVFVVADKDVRATRGAPIAHGLVILVIAPMSGLVVAEALFLLTHGLRPPE